MSMITGIETGFTNMRLPYSLPSLRDEGLDIDLVFDPECELDVSVETDNGVSVINVDAVYMGGKNLFRGGKFAIALACEIANEAENDEKFRETVLEAM